MHLFSQEKADYVLILSSDHIYKMDYRKLIRFHASLASRDYRSRPTPAKTCQGIGSSRCR